MTKHIAFFDSGVGGLTVMHQCRVQMPAENYLYISDSANAPYGNRSAEEITSLTLAAFDTVDFSMLKAVVIACNTATSAAIKKLRSTLTVPVIGMEPAVKPALAMSDHRRILVLATPFTLRQQKFQELVAQHDSKNEVDAMSALELVNFAEEFDFDSHAVLSYVKRLVKSIDWKDYTTLVLGCTHFLYFKKLLRHEVPSHISIIDGHQGTINELKRHIDLEPGLEKGELVCLVSGTKMNSEVLMPYLNILDRSMRITQNAQ